LFVSRLKALKFVQQHRDTHDRRVVWTRISASGLALLQEMDPVIQQLPLEMLGHLRRDELAELIRLLELARKGVDARVVPVTCTGTTRAESDSRR